MALFLGPLHCTLKIQRVGIGHRPEQPILLPQQAAAVLQFLRGQTRLLPLHFKVLPGTGEVCPQSLKVCVLAGCIQSPSAAKQDPDGAPDGAAVAVGAGGVEHIQKAIDPADTLLWRRA